MPPPSYHKNACGCSNCPIQQFVVDPPAFLHDRRSTTNWNSLTDPWIHLLSCSCTSYVVAAPPSSILRMQRYIVSVFRRSSEQVDHTRFKTIRKIPGNCILMFKRKKEKLQECYSRSASPFSISSTGRKSGRSWPCGVSGWCVLIHSCPW